MSPGWTNLSDKLILRSLIYAQVRIALTANAKNNWPRGQMLSLWGVKFRQIFSFHNDGRHATLRPDMDHIIEAKEVQIERKHFYVEFRENDRGKFLRITEEAHGRRNTIIVPSTGVDDFTAAIDEVLDGVEILPA